MARGTMNGYGRPSSARRPRVPAKVIRRVSPAIAAWSNGE